MNDFKQRLEEIENLNKKIRKDSAQLIKDILNSVDGKKITFGDNTIGAMRMDDEGDANNCVVKGVWLDEMGLTRYITDEDYIFSDDYLPYRDVDLIVDNELLIGEMLNNID